MEYNDLNNEQKAQVDQRVEAQAAKDSPLNSLGPAIDYYGAYTGNIEPGMVSPDYYGIKSELDQGAAQTAQPQRQAQPTTRYGQKPLVRTDPALGGDTPITDAGPSPTADGKSFEEQKSTQMMRDMSAGNVDLWGKRAQFNRLTLEQRNRRRAARAHVGTEAVRQAWEQLNDGGGDLRKSKDGKTYRVVMYRNDGEDNPVARLNKMNVNMGKKGTMTSLAVAVEVDKDGKAIGKPVIKYGYNNDGGTKATGFRDVNPAEVMNRWADTYAKRTGQSQLEARRAAVQAFGGDKNLAGANPAGWDIAPTAQEIAAEEKRKADAKMKLERDKIDNQNAQFYASLGFDREKLAQTSAQFDKNYDLALKQFDAGEKHANAADAIAGRKQDLAEKQLDKNYDLALKQFDAGEKHANAADAIAGRKQDLAEKQFDEQVKQTIRGANREDMKLAYEIVTGLQDAGRQPTTGEILKSMGDKTLEHFYKIPVRDENGQMVLNADGAPVTREPETKQEYDQCTENLVKAVNALRTTAGAGGIRDRYTQIQRLAQGISSGEAPAAASAVGDMAGGVAGLNNGGTAPEQRANDAAALLAARGKGGANATQANATNATQANATNATQANATNATQGSSYGLRNDGQSPAQGNAATPTITKSRRNTSQATNTDEEERILRQSEHRRRNIQASGANEEIADYYDSISKEDMQKFRNILGEDVSTADLYAGKYDQGLRNFAELEGNESIPVKLDQIAGLRSKKQATDRGNAIADVTQGRQKEYDDGMAKIRAEAAKKVVRGDWKKADYDKYVKRQESMLSERLRKKYNAIQTAMQ